MKVVFRVDASVAIGSGHVMRCLVLANELQRNGYHIRFACLPQRGDMCKFIEQQGYEVIYLSQPEKERVPQHSSDYLAWLQRSVEEDAQEVIGYLDNVSWLVCDHYALDKKWQQLIKNRTNVNIIAIDDLVRKHTAEIVIDQTISRSQEAYHSAKLALTGIKYALLKPQFSQLRAYVNLRKPDLSLPRVLISMGGIDLPNATLAVLKTLENNAIKCKITVLMNQRSPNFNKIANWCKQREYVTHIAFSTDMANLMLNHDISIGAPGSTSWERACLGLPSIVIPLADNQIEICEQLVLNNLSLKVSLEEIPDKLASSFYHICDNWYHMHINNMAICDGLGVFRVVSKIVELDNARSNNMQ
ncbi:UDP-2,4-diacetamido-2,4,6-trideoxy-beta-L-altropyranose hydrolase [Plesiomonas shigelloides]|uniref:UDP-2,4-diacetamido-2,4, 6-trideoxy-beta-L-altropyranose hydrolase n=1 Tax=Plesiomonas shigelloides TaxID=703 RepID=UPI0022474269|nr:UDP-2,4-diacetamido-2,4,6-trideoxy-beta-L-altropyranose hydrolase [Plesiomonas shigelloides]MCX2497454.1 UDP-2,4-diacetamido-2,4,6-trideoxy-beta-L-altropyranose hydrolase [Plesiomonas shigelloides]